MSALAADKMVTHQDGKLLALPMVASDIVYKGALVKINAAGFLAPCAPEAGSQFAGVAVAKVDNSAGAAGDLAPLVIQDGCHELTGTGFAQADVGSQVYAIDDNDITLTEGTTSKQKVGIIVKFISSTKVLVKIMPYSGIGASA